MPRPPVFSSPCSLPKGPPPFWRFRALSCLTPKSSSSCKGRSTGLSAAQRAALRARTHHQGHPYGQIPVHLSAPALHTCTILRGKLYKEGSVTYTSTLKMKRGLNNTWVPSQSFSDQATFLSRMSPLSLDVFICKMGLVIFTSVDC